MTTPFASPAARRRAGRNALSAAGRGVAVAGAVVWLLMAMTPPASLAAPFLAAWATDLTHAAG